MNSSHQDSHARAVTPPPVTSSPLQATPARLSSPRYPPRLSPRQSHPQGYRRTCLLPLQWHRHRWRPQWHRAGDPNSGSNSHRPLAYMDTRAHYPRSSTNNRLRHEDFGVSSHSGGVGDGLHTIPPHPAHSPLRSGTNGPLMRARQIAEGEEHMQAENDGSERLKRDSCGGDRDQGHSRLYQCSSERRSASHANSTTIAHANGVIHDYMKKLYYSLLSSRRACQADRLMAAAAAQEASRRAQKVHATLDAAARRASGNTRGSESSSGSFVSSPSFSLSVSNSPVFTGHKQVTRGGGETQHASEAAPAAVTEKQRLLLKATHDAGNAFDSRDDKEQHRKKDGTFLVGDYDTEDDDDEACLRGAGSGDGKGKADTRTHEGEDEDDSSGYSELWRPPLTRTVIASLPAALTDISYRQLIGLWLCVLLVLSGGALQVISLNFWIRQFPESVGGPGNYTTLAVSSMMFSAFFLVSLTIYMIIERPDMRFLWHARGLLLLFCVGTADFFCSVLTIYAASHTSEVLQALFTSTAPLFTATFQRLILRDQRHYCNSLVVAAFVFIVTGVLLASSYGVLRPFLAYVGVGGGTAVSGVATTAAAHAREGAEESGTGRVSHASKVAWSFLFLCSVVPSALQNVVQTKYMLYYTRDALFERWVIHKARKELQAVDESCIHEVPEAPLADGENEIGDGVDGDDNVDGNTATDTKKAPTESAQAMEDSNHNAVGGGAARHPHEPMPLTLHPAGTRDGSLLLNRGGDTADTATVAPTPTAVATAAVDAPPAPHRQTLATKAPQTPRLDFVNIKAYQSPVKRTLRDFPKTSANAVKDSFVSSSVARSPSSSHPSQHQHHRHRHHEDNSKSTKGRARRVESRSDRASVATSGAEATAGSWHRQGGAYCWGGSGGGFTAMTSTVTVGASVGYGTFAFSRSPDTASTHTRCSSGLCGRRERLHRPLAFPRMGRHHDSSGNEDEEAEGENEMGEGTHRGERRQCISLGSKCNSSNNSKTEVRIPPEEMNGHRSMYTLTCECTRIHVAYGHLIPGGDLTVKLVLLAADTTIQAIEALFILPTDAIPWWGGSKSVADAAENFGRGLQCVRECKHNMAFGFLYCVSFVFTYVGGVYLDHYNVTLCSMVTQLAAPCTALILVSHPSLNLTDDYTPWWLSILSILLLTTGTVLYTAWDQKTAKERMDAENRVKRDYVKPHIIVEMLGKPMDYPV